MGTHARTVQARSNEDNSRSLVTTSATRRQAEVEMHWQANSYFKALIALSITREAFTQHTQNNVADLDYFNCLHQQLDVAV